MCSLADMTGRQDRRDSQAAPIADNSCQTVLVAHVAAGSRDVHVVLPNVLR